MQGEPVLLERRAPRRAYRVGAAAAVLAAVGATVWGYLEYGGRDRASSLALALGAVLLSSAAAVLLSFRATFVFGSVQAPRPALPSRGAPLRLVDGPRRGLLAVLASSSASLVAMALLPLRSMGGARRRTLRATAWRPGVRLLTPEGAALRPDDLPPGSVTPVVPERAPLDASSIATLVRLRGSGQVRAYSRICTHAGCAVCVFRSDQSYLVCPCHHSLFDAAGAGRVVRGPASRPLPELPLAVDRDGWLVAGGDFDRPIGPRGG